MAVVASLVSAWMAWRWVGFLVGAWRVRRLSGPVRREGRRSVVVRGALNVFGSVAALYLWAVALRLQPTEDFVGLLAALLMISLAASVVAALMQPAERSPETLDICRVFRRDEGEREAGP